VLEPVLRRSEDSDPPTLDDRSQLVGEHGPARPVDAVDHDQDHVLRPSCLADRGGQVVQGPSAVLAAVCGGEHLVREFRERVLAGGEFATPPASGSVEATDATVDDLLTRGQEPIRLHAVQHGVERSGRDVMAVFGQFVAHPGAVDLAFARVVEEV
jgi:hypothetical protein